jgi:vancomycin resistance protein YoaR
MKKLQQPPESRLFKIILYFGLGIICGITLLIAVARLAWHSKFYPGITVANIEIAGLRREDARAKMIDRINAYQGTLTYNGATWKTPPHSSSYLIEETLNEAYHYGRRLKIQDYLLLLINKKTNYPLRLAEGKTEKLETQLREIADTIEIPSVDAEVKIVKQGIEVKNGSDGILIDGAQLDTLIRQAHSQLDEQPVTIPTHTAKRQLSSEEIEQLKTRAQTLLKKSLMLQLEDERIKLGEVELVSFLNTQRSEDRVSSAAIDAYVGGLAERLYKEPQDAKFEFAEGKVKEFAPGKDGIKVAETVTSNKIADGILKLLDTDSTNETVEIEAERTPPKVTTEEVNKLGIKERIGRGESFYAHSIPNRIYNVALASTRINSALVPPGEEVSFNKMVGEVSGATGYREAYIISGGRTVLGDGGGLCQVSTTMFRAAMSAGLPILERWGHAYRVSYYELNSKPGVDATVIAPSKDFRFKNDTPGHILIQTINDPKALHLVIEIYGTSDGRVATTTEPKVWGITPPLPTIYQDDPSLPAGTLKQVDWAASGARASFDYKVVRNGETIQEKTFSTVYRSWASVYLRGTAQ